MGCSINIVPNDIIDITRDREVFLVCHNYAEVSVTSSALICRNTHSVSVE
jgi:hypothetical protein